MHKISEAKKLECRQAFAVTDNGLHFNFPNCSANGCCHWRMTEVFERMQANRYEWELAQGFEPETMRSSVHDPIINKRWDEYIDGLLADGWRTMSGRDVPRIRLPNSESEHFHYESSVWLRRDLTGDDRIGECGLIMPDTLEVNN